jgi:hypothetical protein
LSADGASYCRGKPAKLLEKFPDLSEDGDSLIIIEHASIGRNDCVLGDKWARGDARFEIIQTQRVVFEMCQCYTDGQFLDRMIRSDFKPQK